MNLDFSSERQRFESFAISSFDYFRWLLELQVHNWLALPSFQYQPSQWRLELFEGLVSSADTGSEDLIRVSRAALVNFCDRKSARGENLHDLMDLKAFVCESLFEVAKRNISNDRVLVPTLEVMSFLFDAGIIQKSNLQ
jgi:tubulin-specific chaperone D